jgi:hypothetical protein
MHCEKDLLRESIVRGDFSRSWELLTQILDTSPTPLAIRLAAALVHCRAVAIDGPDRMPFVRNAVETIRQKTGDIDDANAILLGDLLAVHGLRQDASELYTGLLRKSPQRTDILHRLGLCDLSRAATTGKLLTSNIIDRWLRVLACLLSVIYDDRYFREWVEERLQVFGISISMRNVEQARALIVDRLRELMVHQSSSSDRQGGKDTAAALLELSNELQAECSAVELFAKALRHSNVTVVNGIPLPFGMIWYRHASNSLAAASLLGQTVASTLATPLANPDGDVDPTAPTVGIALRQWFSRLAPVRQALRWGQYELASNGLQNICPRHEACRVNCQPATDPKPESPRCCDPSCEQFLQCNPGYAGSENPAADMELDAHRLAFHVELALAEQCLTASTPRLILAAQHWVAGHRLASAIHESSLYEEQVTAQVFRLVDAWHRDPERTTELLDTALRAVPNKTLKGRFVDRLTDRGIKRCNERRWGEGAGDLRLVLALNRHIDRARTTLGFALQWLADQQMEGQDFLEAHATITELEALAQESIADSRFRETFLPLLKWATEQGPTCKLMASNTVPAWVTELL